MLEDTVYLIHGLFLWTAWALFGMVMICSNRWSAYVSDKCQYVHAIAGWIITIITVGVFIFTISNEGVELEGLHTILGFAMTIVVMVLGFGGMFLYSIKNNATWNK